MASESEAAEINMTNDVSSFLETWKSLLPSGIELAQERFQQTLFRSLVRSLHPSER